MFNGKRGRNHFFSHLQISYLKDPPFPLPGPLPRFCAGSFSDLTEKKSQTAVGTAWGGLRSDPGRTLLCPTLPFRPEGEQGQGRVYKSQEHEGPGQSLLRVRPSPACPGGQAALPVVKKETPLGPGQAASSVPPAPRPPLAPTAGSWETQEKSPVDSTDPC